MTKDQIMQFVDEFSDERIMATKGISDCVDVALARAAVVAALTAMTKDFQTQLSDNAKVWQKELFETRTQLDALTKDAGRYQWLRTCNNDSYVIYGDTNNCELMMEEVLDNAIDKAMKEQV